MFAPIGSHINEKIFVKDPKIFFFQKLKKNLGIWPRDSKNQNLKEIHAIGSKIIHATDGRRMTDEF